MIPRTLVMIVCLALAGCGGGGSDSAAVPGIQPPSAVTAVSAN